MYLITVKSWEKPTIVRPVKIMHSRNILRTWITWNFSSNAGF